MKKDSIIYLLTEGIDPEKEKNEIEYLSKISRVIILTSNPNYPSQKNAKRFVLKNKNVVLIRYSILWSKVAYLFSRIANTSSDLFFNVRNVYSGNLFIRKLINAGWAFKVSPLINKLLPSYEFVYFVPHRVVSFFMRKKFKLSFKRILVHDSLVLRMNKFPLVFLIFKNQGIKNFANVKSWDNPYYSQFFIGADGFFLWSESMQRDVRKVHGVNACPAVVWGARPFYKFKSFVSYNENRSIATDGKSLEVLKIGYAAAFCDELMGNFEMELILNIANTLSEKFPDFILKFRPYPILPTEFYLKLTKHPNIEIVGIKGKDVGYNDGKSQYTYKTGSDEERVEYLNSCNLFLSVATSFTIEAAIARVPIVHFYTDQKNCKSEAEKEFFKRVEISDHLLEYFNKELILADNYASLLLKVDLVCKNPNKALEKSDNLLKRMGVHVEKQKWDAPSKEVVKTLEEAMR